MGKADWDNAKRLYPSTHQLTEKDWISFFDRRPDVMHAILGDIYVHTKAHMATVKKTGRRHKYVNGNLDELWDILTPNYSTEPFGPAVRELMGQQSLRSFAAKIPMHHNTLWRLMNGQRNIINPNNPFESMRLLELVARAGNVHPSYFNEWRALYVMAILNSLMEAKPNVSIGLYRQITKAGKS